MGKSSAVSVRGHRRYGPIRGRGLWLAALTILALTALPAAAAQADALWAGANASPEWSQATNWNASGTTPPTANGTAAGIITFPDLGSISTCTATCYTSHNGLTGISSTGLVFSNTTAGTQYKILGNSLALSGGIMDNSGGGTGDVINTPLALSGVQTWFIGNGSGPNFNSLSLAAIPEAVVTGAVPVTVTFGPGVGPASSGDLFVNSDMEVGAVTVNGGAGELHIGVSPGSVNGTNGHAVNITSKATLVANPGATVGALTITGSQLQLGTAADNTGSPGTLGVNGAASVDSASTTTALINDNGSTPGTDFSQLSGNNNVTLAGTLKVDQGPSGGNCIALNKGDVATLFTTTGTLSGTFTNAPTNGSTITMTSSCQSTPPMIQINYTANSVIATVVSGTTPTTTTLATPNPSPAATNQSVTLTATVTTNTNGNVAPSGNVAFSANGSPIAGCTSQAVSASGSTGTATCTTSFAAAHSAESLTAVFTGSGQVTSSSTAQSETVNKSSTGTKLAASSTSPAAGSSVTYTATVTPGLTGSSSPSSTVEFLDGGSPISGCTAQALTSGAATCTVSYPTGGSHTITAVYNGDANFAGSTSLATAVTVTPPVSPPPVKKGRLVGPGGRLTVIGGKIRFTEKCQSSLLCRGGFSLTVTIRTGKHHKLTTVRCASGSFRIGGHRSKTLHIRLTGACLRLLRAQRNHRLTVIYTSKSQTGQAGQRKRITLVLR